VKQHEVGHRALANPAAATAPATSAASAKPSKPSKGNSVPKSNHIAGRSNNHPTSTHHHHQPPPPNLNHKTVTVTDLANSCSTALATEIAIQQVKQSRSYQQQFMPDSSDSDSDDVLSVSSFLKGIGLLFFLSAHQSRKQLPSSSGILSIKMSPWFSSILCWSALHQHIGISRNAYCVCDA
jgi:hypothetical protein